MNAKPKKMARSRIMPQFLFPRHIDGTEFSLLNELIFIYFNVKTAITFAALSGVYGD
jgi:hypothetical protein